MKAQRFIGTRPAAWIDDELLADAFRWAAARDAGGAPTLLLKTEVNVGMTPRHVDTLLAWSRRVMSGSETRIDVLSTAPWPGGALSNFASHSFTVRGVHAASMEGFLQGLKCSDVERQVQIMQLTGLDAKRAGAGFNWRHRQVLYWQGEALDRHGDAYQQLLDEAYDALFVESIEARDALSATAAAFIDHSVGSNDPWETVLTIDEFCSRLVRIRKGLTGR